MSLPEPAAAAGGPATGRASACRWPTPTRTSSSPTSPPDCSCTRCRGYSGPTLVDALAGIAAGGDDARPGIVHRLDRDTSGLLLVARDGRTHARLQAQLRRRRIGRTYVALVRGRPRSRRGRIEAPIGRDRRDPTRMSLETDRPPRRGHRLRARRGAAGPLAPARDAADRAHPPDPRAPGRDRHPRRRRPGLRPRPRARPRAPVPARGRAAARASAHGRPARGALGAPGRPGGGARSRARGEIGDSPRLALSAQDSGVR